MSKMPSLTEMLKAGVHFGHQASRWHPKMQQYIFGSRIGVHVIDLDRTIIELEKTLSAVRDMAASGKTILFVGTKRQAREIIKAAATAAGMPFITERWIGGLLTNFEEFKRRLKKYLQLKDQVATGEIEKYTKKEQGELKKQLAKMDKYLNGVVHLNALPDALYIADMRVEKTAVTEANRTQIAIVGVCDTNVNPLKATYIIPANDDAVNSIKLIADLVAEAIVAGKEEWEKKKLEIKVREEKEKKDKEPARKEVKAMKITESV